MLNPLGHPYPSNGELRVPHNLEVEQALLGAILLDNRAFERAVEHVGAGDFFDPLHGKIFDSLAHIIQSGRLASPMTLKPEFEAYPNVGNLTVPQYLGSLIRNATTVSGAGDYARTVRELADLRSLLLIGQDLASDASSATAQRAPAGIIEDAEAKLFEVAERSSGGRSAIISFSDAAQNAMKAANVARMVGFSGLSTGLVDLDAKLGGLRRSDLIILAGRPSMGKAQPHDAPVLTNSGWRPIGSLRLGDDIASIDGAPSRVAGVFPQGKKQIYRITFSDGRSAECCDEHLWLVHHRKWAAPKVLSTDAIRSLLKKPSMRRRLSIDRVSGHFGDQTDLPVDPWLLGALLGNGGMTEESVMFSTSSTHTLFEIKKSIGTDLIVAQRGAYEFCIRQESPTRKGTCGVTPNPLKIEIQKLGLWGLPSEEKFIPEIYKFSSRDCRVALLRGLLDTDGWVEKHGSIRFCTSSSRLAADFVEMARSIGTICTVTGKHPTFTHRGEKKQGLPAYVCNIMCENGSELFSNPAKRGRVRNEKRTSRLSFISIEPSRIEEAVCIRVTHPSSLYITSDYVVTHNTALATNIAISVAKKGMIDENGEERPAPVAFFSLEMSSEQLATRILAAEAGISSAKITQGKISEDEFRRLSDEATAMTRMPLYIDQTGGISIAQLSARARRAKRQYGIQLLVVDYLQLLSGLKTRSENRVMEITQITTGLKGLAKELNIPIIALSQLSRDLEKRENKRPQLSDLRESGSIEQDADVVMFVFREEYYVERAKPELKPADKFRDWQNKMQACAGKAEVILGKQRHGPIGVVELAFDGSVTRFSDLARRDAP